MKFTISLTVEAPGETLRTVSILTFDKECQDVANIGLSLPESKQLLEALQAQIVQEQAKYFLTQAASLFVGQSAVTETEDSLVMGVGYLRDWTQRKTCFEVIVGKSVPLDQTTKYFGFVQGYDQKSKQRVFEVLSQQGFQGNQRVIFLSDGAANLRQLQSYLTPNAQPILDWFHLTMRFTVLQQYLQGLTKVDADGEQMQKRLESAKWHLWHGNTTKSLELINDLDCNADLHRQQASTKYEKIKPLIRYLSELKSYIRQNAHLIVDYSEGYRYSEAISTGFVRIDGQLCNG